MPFFSTLSTALTALQSQLIAINTIGHNIANATTPGFSRQRAVLETRQPHNLVVAQIGAGVKLKMIQRAIDLNLEARLRSSLSDLSNFKVSSQTLQQVESAFQAMSDVDIMAQLAKLFEALNDLSNNPQNPAARNMTIQTASTLARSLNKIVGNINKLRQQLDEELQLNLDQINGITEEIAKLNKQILLAENGGKDVGTANDLRDKRDLLLKQLSEFVGINVVEMPTGEVTVLLGSSYLVLGGQSFDLDVVQSPDMQILVSQVVFADGSAPAVINNGTLKGIINMRDITLRDIIRDLNTLANSLSYEFNKVHSTGSGLKRYTYLESEQRITDPDFPVAISGRVTAQSVSPHLIIDSSLIGSPLNLVGKKIFIFSGDEILEERTITLFDATTGTIQVDSPFRKLLPVGTKFQIGDLPFPVKHGSFKVIVTNESTGAQSTYTINVDVDKILPDTTLNDIVSQLNAIQPWIIIADTIDMGRLRIKSTDSNITFRFANDTSGFLSAMGLAGFFKGDDAFNIGVNDLLLSDHSFLATAKSNEPGDNSNVLAMIDLRDQPLVKDEASFEKFYQNLVGRIGSEAFQAKTRFEAQQLVQQQLENQRQRVSGVNIDEEVTNMLVHQRAFQAAARLIATVDSMLETLIGSV